MNECAMCNVDKRSKKANGEKKERKKSESLKVVSIKKSNERAGKPRIDFIFFFFHREIDSSFHFSFSSDCGKSVISICRESQWKAICEDEQHNEIDRKLNNYPLENNEYHHEKSLEWRWFRVKDNSHNSTTCIYEGVIIPYLRYLRAIFIFIRDQFRLFFIASFFCIYLVNVSAIFSNVHVTFPVRFGCVLYSGTIVFVIPMNEPSASHFDVVACANGSNVEYRTCLMLQPSHFRL